MSLWAPVNKDEVSRSGWAIGAFMIGPLLLHMGFWWHVNFSSDRPPSRDPYLS